MLENYTLLLDEVAENAENKRSNLRFNQPAAVASDIAQQYFCEKKVELSYVLGEVETEAKRLGTEAHQTLLQGSEKVQTEELWEKIFSAKPVAALEWLLAAKYGNVTLAGKPDCIIFRKGKPLIILEYKFSGRLMAFRGHHVQARTYGLLLNRMGFDTGRLLYAVVVVNPRVEDIDDLKKEIVKRIMNEPREGVLKLEGACAYVNRFELGEAERDLDWALSFWTKRREAVPTRNPNKCRSCEYAQKCAAATNNSTTN